MKKTERTDAEIIRHATELAKQTEAPDTAGAQKGELYIKVGEKMYIIGAITLIKA